MWPPASSYHLDRNPDQEIWMRSVQFKGKEATEAKTTERRTLSPVPAKKTANASSFSQIIRKVKNIGAQKTALPAPKRTTSLLSRTTLPPLPRNVRIQMFVHNLFVRTVGLLLLLSLYLPWYPPRRSLNIFSNEMSSNVPAAALGTFANNHISDINCSSKSILSQDPMTLARVCVPFYVFYSPMQILGKIDFTNIFCSRNTEGWISSLVAYSSSYSSNPVSQFLHQFNTLPYQFKGEHLLLAGWGLLFFLALTMIAFKWGLKLALPVAAVLAWSESGKLPLQLDAGFYGVMFTLLLGLVVECRIVECFIASLKSLGGLLGTSKAAKKKTG